MNADEALSIVEAHGIVLVSAKGAVPRLTELVAGEAIKGSWWAHPKGREIYAILQSLSHSPDVLTCRLLAGRVTLVHLRLWPALVRMADQIQPDFLAQVHDEHTPSGQHAARQVDYPKWVPLEIFEQARLLTEQQARALLGPGLSYSKSAKVTKG